VTLSPLRGPRLRATYESLEDDEGPSVPVAPFRVALFDADRAVIETGRLRGTRIEFLRDEKGRLRFVRVGGRLLRRTRGA
jgi:hypothetical protein